MSSAAFVLQRSAIMAFALLALIAFATALPADARGADRVILRDLTVVTGRTVTACDEDGAHLDEALADGRQVLRWDEILRGNVADERQASFDELLQKYGLTLLRVRMRLKVGDYRGAWEPAQALAPVYLERKSDSAYLVALGLMWGALANGEPEAAVAPYLRALELVRTEAADPKRVPTERRFVFDPQTGLAADFKPLWFDPAAAAKALPEVRETITAMSTPRPEATRLYYGVLAIVAGDEATAGKMLDGWTPEARPLAELQRIALAQREVASGKPGMSVAALQAEVTKLSPMNRPLAEFWLASAAAIQASELASRQDAALDLLAIPARHGAGAPAVSAAALYRALELLEQTGDKAGAAAIGRELLDRYPTTWQAHRFRARRVAPATNGGVK